jgi:hypothetical protein
MNHYLTASLVYSSMRGHCVKEGMPTSVALKCSTVLILCLFVISEILSKYIELVFLHIVDSDGMVGYLKDLSICDAA